MENPLPAGLIAIGKKAMLVHGAIGFARGRGLMNPIRSVLTHERRDALKQWARAQTPSELALDIMGLEQSRQKLLNLGKPVQEVAESMKILSDEVDRRRRRQELNPSMGFLNMSQFDRYVKKAPDSELVEMIDQIQKEKRKFRGTSAEDREAQQGIDQVLLTIARELNDREDRPLLNPEDKAELLKKLTATRDRMSRSLATGKISWDNEPFVLQWRVVVNRVKELEKELRSGTTRRNPFGPRARFVHEEEIGKQRLSALRRTHPDLVVRTVTNGPHRIRIALWGRRRDGSYAHDETISVLHPRGERNPRELAEFGSKPFGLWRIEELPNREWLLWDGRAKMTTLHKTREEAERAAKEIELRAAQGSRYLPPNMRRNPMPKERDVNNIFRDVIKEMAKLGQGPDVNTIEGQRVLRALKVAANSLSEAERNIHTFEATKPGLFGRIIGKRAGTPRQPPPKVARALL